MKKLALLLVLAAFTIHSSAQLELNNPNRYTDHIAVGSILGFGANIGTYKLLTHKRVKVPPIAAKIAAPIVSSIVIHGLATLWENNTGVYNQNDIKYTNYGSIVGNLLGSVITFKSAPRWWVKKKGYLIIDNEKDVDPFDIQNDPLALIEK